MTKKLLLCIDCQYGFIEGGNLPVEGAKKSMDKLALFCNNNGTSYDKILLTVDWHPHTHCSFKENGGIWPEHCIQHTHDAAIYQPIIDALNNIGNDYTVLTKGIDEDHEEYSIFKNFESCDYIIDYCKNNAITDIYVVGIAYDVCVGETVKDGLRALPNIKFHVIKDFCPSISKEGENKITNFIENSERICLE